MLIRNFLFHRVSPEKDTMWPPMQPSLFENTIRYLTRQFQVVPLEEYLNEPEAFSNRKKIATVLFDDGYKDNIEYAAPILKKYNCPASFYVVTDCINRNLPTWTYILDHALQQTKKEKLDLSFDYVPSDLKGVTIQNSEKLKEIKPWIKTLANGKREEVVQSILEQCNDVNHPEKKMMSWDEVRQLYSSGFIIGSHSHTHPMLASIEDEDGICNELQTSAAIIKKEIGAKPLTISYPIGSLDDRVTRLSKQLGYRYGLAVEQQFYRQDSDDHWRIPRVELYQEPWWKVQLRIIGVYSRVKKIWQKTN